MKLHVLKEAQMPEKRRGYTTFGCMWKKGECKEETDFVCRNEAGEQVPMQTRITAYWADGSIKWTAHTADMELLGKGMEVLPQISEPFLDSEAKKPENEGKTGTLQSNSAAGIIVEESENELTLKGRETKIYISKKGGNLFEKIEKNGAVKAFAAAPVLMLEEPATIEGNPAKIEKEYAGLLEEVTLEEQGALQCIVCFKGTHVRKNVEGEDTKIPFIIRLKFGYDSDNLIFTHTFLYDGDENKDYLKGLGIRVKFPMEGELYNRHIKLTGDHGVFHEGAVTLVSWRPRVPRGVAETFFADQKIEFEGECADPAKAEQGVRDKEAMTRILSAVPVWNTYDICQDSDSHFAVKKKLKGDHLCYIDCLHGNRTDGGLAVGSPAGTVLFGIRDFWQKYPSGYTVKGFDEDTAECTMWLWSPSANAMDFRHYADRGYNQVCYEGYDYKGADPDGIACTNEFGISFSDKIICTDEELTDFVKQVNFPPVYVGTPEFYHEMRAFGYWSLIHKDTPMEEWLEKQLEQEFDFYSNEVEQRKWYGMFNYGDFMHTYDLPRHQWRYDVGGYAWDNTELVPTLWLWLYFLRTGRADVYRLAEKLSRHASEVDVYHLGRYKGLGSRHNVRHWGCPCKEARIAMAHHHRVLYFLTGDRRLEDIFDELKDNELSFLNRDPLGDFFDKSAMTYPSHARSGPDWSSLCSNWMTRYERTGEEIYRKKIETGIADIAAAPLKLVSGPDFEFDPATCHLRYIGERTTGGVHLQICMGAPEIWFEMADHLENEEWKEMLAALGRFYFLPKEEQQKESGGIIGKREFTYPFMASAMGAYGAVHYRDEELAKRTWRALLETILSENNREGFSSIVLKDEGNCEDLTEIPWISTNFAAQFGLNVIVALDFIREWLPKDLEDAEKLLDAARKGAFHSA